MKRALVSIFIVFLSGLSLADGYEAQFNHSVKRWGEAIEYYRHTTKPIELVYLCAKPEDRDKLASEFADQKKLISKEGSGSYKAKLVVYFLRKPAKDNELFWLRKNFFLGVANGCSMDGFQ